MVSCIKMLASPAWSNYKTSLFWPLFFWDQLNTCNLSYNPKFSGGFHQFTSNSCKVGIKVFTHVFSVCCNNPIYIQTEVACFWFNFFLLYPSSLSDFQRFLQLFLSSVILCWKYSFLALITFCFTSFLEICKTYFIFVSLKNSKARTLKSPHLSRALFAA